MRIRFVLPLAAAFACAGLALAQPPQPKSLILSGPMIGHTTDSSAWVWIEAEAGTAVNGDATQPGIDVPSSTTPLGGGFALVKFSGLEPATETQATIRVSDSTGRSDVARVSFRTAPAPAASGTVRFAFGSCAKATFDSFPIYKAVALEKPDFMIFVGDNSYFVVGGDGPNAAGTSGPFGDWTSADKMLARHLEMRRTHDLQTLLRNVPSYAVWDDHDYGPNNADMFFPLKDEALRLFRQVWANPSYGSPATPGIFSSFRWGPVEVFLMDDRYHKWAGEGEREGAPAETRIWGPEQTTWLMEALRSSTAPVKIVANGTQVVTETERGEGHFQEARAERDRLFAHLAEHKIGGVVFVSGDRHYSEANRFAQDGGPDILEFTSSPMRQGKEIGPLEVRHRNQIWGMNGDSYGLVTVEVREDGSGSVRFEARDETNSVPVVNAQRCATTWDLRKLQYGR